MPFYELAGNTKYDLCVYLQAKSGHTVLCVLNYGHITLYYSKYTEGVFIDKNVAPHFNAALDEFNQGFIIGVRDYSKWISFHRRYL